MRSEINFAETICKMTGEVWKSVWHIKKFLVANLWNFSIGLQSGWWAMAAKKLSSTQPLIWKLELLKLNAARYLLGELGKFKTCRDVNFQLICSQQTNRGWNSLPNQFASESWRRDMEIHGEHRLKEWNFPPFLQQPVFWQAKVRFSHRSTSKWLHLVR